jgi:hypothetical protein
VELLSRTVDGETRRYRYRFTYSAEPLLLDIGFGKSGKIEALRARPQ